MQFSAFETYAAAVGIPVGIPGGAPVEVPVAVIPEAQNSEYESGLAQMEGEAWHIRTARNTPTKPGAFLAFWRRDAEGKTAPFGDDDAAAGLLVFVEQQGRRGVFRFTAADLARLGISSGVSLSGRSGVAPKARAGKRGFRVYPSWCTDLNAQAAATQRAQAPAFSEY